MTEAWAYRAATVSTLIIVQNPKTGERRQNLNITPAAYIVSGLKSAGGQRGRSLLVGSFHICTPPRLGPFNFNFNFSFSHFI